MFLGRHGNHGGSLEAPKWELSECLAKKAGENQCTSDFCPHTPTLPFPTHKHSVSGNSQCRVEAALPHKDCCLTEWRHTQLSCKGVNSAMGSNLYPTAWVGASWASWPCWDPAWENYNMLTRIWTPLIFKVMSNEHSFCRGGQGEGRKAHTWQRNQGRPSQADACVLFPMLLPCCCPGSCSTSAALTILQ